MGLTSGNLPAFVDGNVINAADFNTRFTKITDFLNGGIVAGDLQTSSKWVKPRHLVPPRYFGAPAPRVLMPSADLHHRNVDQQLINSVVFAEDGCSDQWLAIPGLSATFYVDVPDGHSNALLDVDAHFLAFEEGGLDSDLAITTGGAGTYTNVESNSYIAAVFALFIDGSRKTYSQRNLFSSTNGGASTPTSTPPTWSRKHHNITAHHSALDAGMHSVSVRVKINNIATTNRNWNRVWIQARGLLVDVQYV